MDSSHADAIKFFNSTTASSYDYVVAMTTFGRDAAWKREIVKIMVARRLEFVLDLACGTGILSSTVESATEHQNIVVGIDLTFDYLKVARRKLQLPVVQGTAEVLPYRGEAFDAVVSSYLAKYVDIDIVTKECWRVIKPGGVVIFHDFTCPENSAVYGLWKLYFSILRISGLFATSWKEVFSELDGVIRDSRWVDWTTKALQKQGFEGISCRRYTIGTSAIVTGRKP